MAYRTVVVEQTLTLKADFGEMPPYAIKDYVKAVTAGDWSGDSSIYDFEPDVEVTSIEVK